MRSSPSFIRPGSRDEPRWAASRPGSSHVSGNTRSGAPPRCLQVERASVARMPQAATFSHSAAHLWHDSTYQRQASLVRSVFLASRLAVATGLGADGREFLQRARVLDGEGQPCPPRGSMALTVAEQRAMRVSPVRRRARQCSRQISPALTQDALSVDEGGILLRASLATVRPLGIMMLVLVTTQCRQRREWQPPRPPASPAFTN